MKIAIRIVIMPQVVLKYFVTKYNFSINSGVKNSSPKNFLSIILNNIRSM